MNSVTSVCVLSVLACLVVPKAPAESFIGQSYRSRAEAPNGNALRRILLQEGTSSGLPVVSLDGRPLPSIVEIANIATVTVDRLCLIAASIVRPGNTYRDPSSLVPDDVFECCFACDNDERCVTWTYDRFAGAWAQKTKFQNLSAQVLHRDRSDSSLAPEQTLRAASRSDTNSISTEQGPL